MRAYKKIIAIEGSKFIFSLLLRTMTPMGKFLNQDLEPPDCGSSEPRPF
jgi:hypothetical protein